MSELYRILVVDDEPELATSVIDFLAEHEGIESSFVTSGAEATELIIKGSYDLVLCDIKMPEMTGLALFSNIKANMQNCPSFLFMSGYSEYSAESVSEMGAIGLLSKPLDFDVLLEIIKLEQDH